MPERGVCRPFGAIWTFLTEVAGVAAVMILASPDRERVRFRAELEKAVEPFLAPGDYAVPGTCLNVSASQATSSACSRSFPPTVLARGNGCGSWARSSPEVAGTSRHLRAELTKGLVV